MLRVLSPGRFNSAKKLHNKSELTKPGMRQKVFDFIPVIIMTMQFVVLVCMMVTNWFNKDPPEMPYDWTAPAGSLGLGFIMILYNYYKVVAGNVPTPVLLANIAWVGVTAVLLGLSIAFPERQCCCPGGVKAEKVEMGKCPNKEAASTPTTDDAASE